jgi:hypothetical protein
LEHLHKDGRVHSYGVLKTHAPLFSGGMAQMKEFIVERKNQQTTRVAIQPILGSQMFTASNMDIRKGETI